LGGEQPSNRGKIRLNPGALAWLPTLERPGDSPEGFHEQNLAPAGAPPVVRAVEAAVLTPPEAARRKSFLDRALDDGEV
jgi:hypothetical protein